MNDPKDKGNPTGGFHLDPARTLRRRAEEELDTLEALDPEVLGPERTRRLLHELRVHQIELTMQNEELRRAQEELETSRARYVDLYDFAPVGYLTVSEHGMILEANLTAATLLGTARGALVRQPLTRFILPADQDIYYRHYKALFATGEPQVFEMRMKRPDAGEFCARFDATMAREEPSAKPVCRVTITDISRHLDAEEALKNNEIRFRELFRNMTSGVAVYEAENDGADFVFRDINEAGLRIGGLGREEVVGRRLTGVFPGVVDMGLMDLLRRVWRTGHAEFHPTAYYADARQSRWYENRVYKLPSGEIVAVYDDVTERKRAEAERERLLTAIEQTGETVVITDPEGTIQYVNPAFEAVTGYSRPEAIGQNPRILKSGVQDEAFYRGLWKTISGGGTWNGRMVNKRRDGTLFTEEATISPVRDASGRVISYVAVKRDITNSLEMEARFRQAQKMESVGRLAGGVAHDFNNMLSVILGYSELALNRVPPTEPLCADLKEIVKAAKRSRDLTRHLLAFARKQIVAPRVIALNDAVADMLTMLRRLIGEEIDLAWLPGNSLWPVWIDPAQVHQILANLCVNARDAIAGTGRITIETTNAVFDEAWCANHAAFVPGEHVQIAVSDDGCGMDKGALEHLFEPFFTTKEIGRGTGLGLATVYGIVTQNSGFIDVRSEPGKGTTLKICLPRYKGPDVGIPKESTSETSSSKGETLLLVEDEPQILEMTRTMLEGFGYRVLAACTPEEALRLAERHGNEIRLLITDVVMPEMNGPVLAGRLHALCPHIKHLFISGYTADVIAKRGMLDEGMLFIQKPFSMRDLAAGVRAALGKE